MSRETALAALLERMRAKVPGLATVERKYIDPDQLKEEAQPALLLIADNYTGQVVRGKPPVWTVHGAIIIYARAEQATDSPETPLNKLIDAVEEALKRRPDEAITDMSEPYHTTLGGTCSRCSISGPIDLIPGEAGGQAAALIPVEILMP